MHLLIKPVKSNINLKRKYITHYK